MITLCVTEVYAPPISYASPTSTLKCSGKSRITAKNMTTSIGTLAKGANAILEGVNYKLDTATYMEDGGTNVTGSATLDANNDTITSSDGQQVVSNTGCTVNQTLVSAGKNASLEGVASNFPRGNTIILADSSTILDVALTSPLTTSIAFNQGTIKLIQDLKISGTATFIGDGTIDFNIRSLIFDGNPRTIGGKILFQQASDFIFGDKFTLTGEITFSGDSVMIGNGNILDISQGGTIRIKRNTTVDFVNAKLKGLGVGQIVFEHPTSQLRLSNIEIEMNRDYTVTIGGIYAEGPTTIVTGNNILRFDQQGSMTVDNITLWYDTLKFMDRQNIRPLIMDNGSHITSVNSGVIRPVCCPYLGDIIVTPSNGGCIDGILVLNPMHKLIFAESGTFSACSNFILFSNSDVPLLIVNPGKNVVLTDVFLQNFDPALVSLGAGSSLIFGDMTEIGLARGTDLNTTWTFQGSGIINGEDHCLDLGTLGNIVVDKPGSSLQIENIVLMGVKGNNIRCTDNTSTISFSNVQWFQDADFSFTTGCFEVPCSSFVMNGGFVFTYGSNRQSLINSTATLTLERGITFSYAPIGTDNRDLIALEDGSAAIFMFGATLASTTTGMRLTKGQLIVDHKNYFRSDLAASVSEGITFGNGNAADDLLITLLPGGSINVLSGALDYQNVN